MDRIGNVRAEMVQLAMDFVAHSDVQGDYLEFGVYKGRTFAAAVHAAQRFRLPDMRFHAFDSFEGLPAPAGVDRDGFVQFAEGEFSASRKRFDSTLRRAGVDAKRVSVTPGWFSDSLTEITARGLAISKAAVVWIDCDLYESTLPVLPFVQPLLQDGTVLIFDDWFCFRGHPDRGEQRAVREWLETDPGVALTEFRNFGWHGKAFIVHHSRD